VLGCVYAWRVTDDVISMADDTLALVSGTLSSVQQSLAVVSATLESGASAIDSLHVATMAVSGTLETTRLALDDVADLATGELATSIGSTSRTLQSLEQTAGIVDEALRGLSVFGIGAYGSETSLQQSIVGVRTSLEPVSANLDRVGGGVRQTAVDLAQIQEGVALIDRDLLAIRDSIAGVRRDVARYLGLVEEWQAHVSVVQKNLARIVRGATWGVSLLLIGIGISQLTVVRWGIRLTAWQGDRL
jgi:hypothetical protein